MYLTTEIFMQIIVKNIFTYKLTGRKTFKAWLASNRFRSFSALNGDVSFKPYDKEEFVNAIINDACRFCCSSLETVVGINKNARINKSTAWILIKLYYSAFYSAHAIIRYFGISFSYLEREYINIVVQNYKLFNGSDISIDKGFYEFNLIENINEVKMTKYKDSHTDLWNIFYTLLTRIQDEIKNRNVNKINILNDDLIKLDEYIRYIKETMNNENCHDKHNWLSIVRNNINYKHEYNVWFPFGKRFSNDRIYEIAKDWNKDHLEIRPDNSYNKIEQFSLCCISIVSIAMDLSIKIGTEISKQSIFKDTFYRLFNSCNT
ncbi:hypothetical protein LQZ19_16530 [Treponema primitia]|uniref:hypothetical protein n=1 Tax=Treponema primitia TaxID=88058 RepID=UPI00397FB89B